MPRKPEIPRKSEVKRPLKRLAPMARAHRITQLDRRTSQAKLMRKVENELIGLLGSPTVAEKIIIHHISVHNMIFETIRQELMTVGHISELKFRRMVTCSGIVIGGLLKLGVKPASVNEPTLHEYLDARDDKQQLRVVS